MTLNRHVHHIIRVSRGGESELNNLCLVCPTHHVAIHMDDAVFDYAGLEDRYSNGLVEPLMLNRHLMARSDKMPVAMRSFQ